MLIQRGIEPENLPPEEDIKKLAYEIVCIHNQYPELCISEDTMFPLLFFIGAQMARQRMSIENLINLIEIIKMGVFANGGWPKAGD